jgi:hypothetical protein
MLVRRGQRPKARLDRPIFPTGSVGGAWLRVMALREAEHKQRGIEWTSEQKSRDDWPRPRKWLGPAFGDCDPRTIQPEHFLELNEKTGTTTGLLAEIERKVSVSERHCVVKVWRSFWKKMAGMSHDGGKYCELDADPAKSFRNSAPEPRQAAWQRRV